MRVSRGVLKETEREREKQESHDTSLALAFTADESGPFVLRLYDAPAPFTLAAAGPHEERRFSIQELAEVTLERLDVPRSEIAAPFEQVLRRTLPLRDAYFDAAPFSVVGVPGAFDPDLDGHSSTSFRLPVR